MTESALPSLPLPVIEREPAFQELFDARIAQMRELLPSWDTYMLRSDPINLMCRHAAYGDLLYAQALNDTFRATLLDFGQGADLEAQASDWGLTLAPGEDHETLRRRLRERKKGQGGFTENWYKRWAFGAAPDRVADVGVAADGTGDVMVSVLSADNGGVADQTLLDIVAAALASPLVRGDNDHIRVVPAVIRVVDISAQIWLLPEAPESAIAAAENGLRDKFAAERRLGWDFTGDWAVAALRAPGVRRVKLEQPGPDAVISTAPNEAVALGAVTITFAGRGY